MKFKYILLFLLETIIFYVSISLINDSDCFNYLILFVVFLFGFIVGMNKNKFKYLYPIVVCYTFIFAGRFNVKLLFMHYLIYGYMGLFVSSTIRLFVNRKKLKKILI